MGADRETKEKLLASAKTEFMEKGYAKASLRKICANAGVTTGALYFFFNDKEDLLKNLVMPALAGLTEILNKHMSFELETNADFVSDDENSDDIATAKAVVRFMYSYYDEFLILLTKSQGSEYENIVDSFADMAEKHYNKLANAVVKARGIKKRSRYMLHWMSHLQVNAFVHLMIHEPDEKKALEEIEPIVIFLINGWNGMLHIQ